MAKVKFRTCKEGEAIMFKDEVWVITYRHEQLRGNTNTVWTCKLKNLQKGNVFEQSFRPQDEVEKVYLERETYEFLYEDDLTYVFMHPETYEQIPVSKDCLGEKQRDFMIPNTNVTLLKVDEKVAQIELPQIIEAEVTEAFDAAKGDTATGVTKMVTIETGAEVRVPGHIKQGDRIRIKTEDGEFQGRVN